MFPNWLQLRRRRHEISPDSPRWSRRFSCSSFKDIEHLLYDDVPSPEPYSPRLQILHQPRSPRIDGSNSPANFVPPPPPTTTLFSVVDIPNADHGGVVLYYTSLRIVRKTFEECRSVRSILHRIRIPIDERDLSMDSRFHDELQTIFGTRRVALPKVFIGGRYIGGTEEIKQLQERDELRKLIGELPPSDGKKIGEICDLCRGWRFVLCERCNGSHKIFSEKSGFISCTGCNVQRLVRCSLCFPVHRRRNSDFSGGFKSKN
ncbi:hypothetical protein EUTSA_v10017114mg [Eutrema salsugineum]|uniref:Glutaredoxin domain-containing protein n=1 Tax=Eutrema salsugineum TaxID=72664 RepID=V4P0F1_EUTSA|nr:uncharacterized protein At5g39865 [Eutrema salsugineum]ESQ52736.1 hypothetical protein EUTSA_v10017114mg [Eutrema salsugineum]